MPYRQNRVQARRRFLEDHGNASAAHIAHARFGEAEQLNAVQAHGTGHDPPLLRQQPHQRERGHALAAAGLADDGERLAARDLEVHAV